VEQIIENNNLIYICDGAMADGNAFKAGISKGQVAELATMGLTVKLTQLSKIVSLGLVTAKCRFRGLKRPLLQGDNLDGDKDKEVHTWRHLCDYDWSHQDRFDKDKIIETEAPKDCIFFTIITPNKKIAIYPRVNYWIEHWGWYPESRTLPGAPDAWEDRYDEFLQPPPPAS